MTSLAHAAAVLEMPRRLEKDLRESYMARRQVLDDMEEALLVRERNCTVREAAFSRAVDAGSPRLSETALRDWLERQFLPSLPPPTSVTKLNALMERRASDLDARLIYLESREIELHEVAEELALRESEMALREDDALRRSKADAAKLDSLRRAAEHRLATADRALDRAFVHLAARVDDAESAARDRIVSSWSIWMSDIHLRRAKFIAEVVQRDTARRPASNASSTRAADMFRKVVAQAVRQHRETTVQAPEDSALLEDEDRPARVSTRSSQTDDALTGCLGTARNAVASRDVGTLTAGTTVSRLERLLPDDTDGRLEVPVSFEGDSFDPDLEASAAEASHAAARERQQLADRVSAVEQREREVAVLAEYVLAQRRSADLIAATMTELATRAETALLHQPLLAASERPTTRGRHAASDGSVGRPNTAADAEVDADASRATHPLIGFTRRGTHIHTYS